MTLEDFMKLPDVWQTAHGHPLASKRSACREAVWKRRARMPNGQTARAYQWADGNLQINVYRRGWGGGYHLVDNWENLDVLGLQCVLFELWARPVSWWRKLLGGNR